MDTHEITFAGGSTPAHLPGGNYLEILESTGPITVELLRNGQVVEKGEDVDQTYYTERPAVNVPNLPDTAPWFDAVRLTSATAQTIKVGRSWGRGGYKKNRGDVTVEPSSGWVGSADVTAADAAQTLIVAANTARRGLWLTNTSNSISVRLGGDGTVGAASGILLQQGQTIEAKTTAAIYAWGLGGTADIAITEET